MQLPLPLPDQPHLTAPAEVPRPRRVYVNRNLRFDLVDTVGFDMDYTLAIYRQAEIDRLTFQVGADRLVDRGYPELLREIPCRTDFGVRGLVVDRKRGHILKMDRYRYVKKAFHGYRELTRDERQQLYHARPIRLGSGRYHWIDTLYGQPEVSLFAAAVHALEEAGHQFDPGALFDAIRESVDAAHADTRIPAAILAEPERYVARDPELGPALEALKAGGKRLFLLTNSGAEYTESMLAFLFGDGAWRELFDVTITSARKPSFFTETGRAFARVDDPDGAPVEAFEAGVMYRGGCLDRFQTLAGASGDSVLYVGDHIYGDVLRAKKETAWRTAMILQEMDEELRVHGEVGPLLERIDHLEVIRDLLHTELRLRQQELRRLDHAVADARRSDSPRPDLEATRVHHRKQTERLKTRVTDLDRELNDLEERVDETFHPYWGSLFKAGPEVSLFADQVEQWACLYTDRVSNLLFYSPLHYFRSPRDRMPHELADAAGR